MSFVRKRKTLTQTWSFLEVCLRAPKCKGEPQIYTKYKKNPSNHCKIFCRFVFVGSNLKNNLD
jgi:hypothetical protein